MTKLSLRKISLKSFRGCADGEYTFNGNSKIKGCNGSGKSTIMSGAMWCMADVDSKLVKNPSVVPIGSDECTPTVEIEFELDGKPLTICKQQKFKKKEVDGKITSSVTNSYSINGIEKSFKAFVEDLNERGIDTENFLYMCHPDAFLQDTSAKGREKIRGILFGMIDGISDLDIAKDLNVPELYALLDEKGYKVEEVESMAKSSLKKLNDKYGKQNELIDSKISGIIESKSTLDINVLNEQKKSYEAEIERCESELADLNGGKNEMAKRCFDLRDKRSELIRKAKENLYNEREELEAIKHDLESTLKENEFQLREAEREAERTNNLLKEAKADLENQRTHYKMEQDAVMDESDLSCPLCHTSYSESKVKKLKAEFERNKAEKLKTIKSMGEDIKSRLKGYEDALSAIQRRQQTLKDVISATDGMLIVTKEKLNKLPNDIDMTQFVEIDSEIAKLESELMEDEDDSKSEIEDARNVAKQMLTEIIANIGVVEHNKTLDEQIASLREEKKQAEIQRANNEKLLYQVQIFTQAKNDLLTNRINERFSMVDWHLWEYQKNGEIKPVCEPYIDGKPMSSASNGSLVTLAKISICADLQKHFGQIMPIWVEDYSLFSSNTEARLNIDSQIIGLVVTEDKELRVDG